MKCYIEAKNTVSLLKLDDPALADKRKKYISRKRKEIELFAQGEEAFFTTLKHDDNFQISYTRTIKAEFAIDIWDMLGD